MRISVGGRWRRSARIALDALRQDLGYAARGLRRSPLFTATALVTLALATGAVTTAFHLAYGLFWRPLAAASPGDLVVVSATRARGTELGPISLADFTRLRASTHTLVDLAAHYSSAPLYVVREGVREHAMREGGVREHAMREQRGEDAGELNGAVVSAGYFQLLGLRPALGRFFEPAEDAVPDRDPVAVLSYDLWQRWYGGSREALGSTVRVNGTPLTLIGVAPAGSMGLASTPVDLYLPTAMLRVGYRFCADPFSADCTVMSMIGRLPPGGDRAAARDRTRAELQTLVPERWSRSDGEGNSGLTALPARGAPHTPADTRLLILLAVAAGTLLAVSAANLSGLMLARSSARARELAVRISLGARRRRLIAQVLAESLLLAVVGGVGGVILAQGFTRALERRFFSSDSEGYALHFDFAATPWVVLAALAVSLLAGGLAGWLPAARAVREGAAAALKQTRGTPSRGRFGRWLLSAQAAAAVALLAVAGLTWASAEQLENGVGYAPAHVAVLRLRPRLVEYAPGRAQAYLREVERALAATPGVESLSLVSGGVLGSGGARIAPATGAETKESGFAAGYLEIGSRYFATLGTPLVSGREFGDADDERSAAVAIVNETLARRLWPRGDALGASLRVEGERRQVVGVVRDVPLESQAEGARPAVFVPFWQNPEQVDARFCVRVAGDPSAALPQLVRTIRALDPTVPVTETMPLSTQLAGRFRAVRMGAAFLGFASLLAVLLTLMGLYSALALAVVRRTKEIGIRLAIGGPAGGVVRLIAGQGLLALAVGILPGVVLALAGARLASHLLFGARLDLAAVLGSAAVLATLGWVACWLPARRAARIEPAAVLRAD